MWTIYRNKTLSALEKRRRAILREMNFFESKLAPLRNELGQVENKLKELENTLT
jgi:predicted  nucleic acid-binding Zn-ribbon protein